MTTHTARPRKPRSSWTVRISSVLLIVQAAAIFLSLLYMGTTIYAELEAYVELEAELIMPSEELLDVVITILWLAPIGFAVGLAGIALFSGRQSAWLVAMLLQAFILTFCLVYHFALPDSLLHDSLINYALMILGIVMVFYLNTADVRLAFRPAETLAASTPVEAGHEY